MATKELGVITAYGTWLKYNSGTEEQFLQSLKGLDGGSAYEVAVANGFSGDEAEWLASLKGEVGDTAHDVPPGGASGEVLRKSSNEDFELEWAPSLPDVIDKSNLSSSVQDSLNKADDAVPSNTKGVANGVASLDQDGLVPFVQLPWDKIAVPEAPLDGDSYVRLNKEWVPLPSETDPIYMSEKHTLATNNFVNGEFTRHDQSEFSHQDIRNAIEALDEGSSLAIQDHETDLSAHSNIVNDLIRLPVYDSATGRLQFVEKSGVGYTELSLDSVQDIGYDDGSKELTVTYRASGSPNKTIDLSDLSTAFVGYDSFLSNDIDIDIEIKIESIDVSSPPDPSDPLDPNSNPNSNGNIKIIRAQFTPEFKAKFDDKVDSVLDAVEDNFVSFGEDGTIKDSGISSSDFISSEDADSKLSAHNSGGDAHQDIRDLVSGLSQSGTVYDSDRLGGVEASEYIKNSDVSAVLEGVNERIDNVSNLGQFVGSFESFAEVSALVLSDFPVGIGVNDFITVRVDETHDGKRSRYVLSELDRDTEVLTWSYDFDYSTDITGKVDKVVGADVGNIVVFGSGGSLEDSTKAVNDFATAAQGTKADNALPKAGGTMAGDIEMTTSHKIDFGSGGQIKQSGGGLLVKSTGNQLILNANDAADDVQFIASRINANNLKIINVASPTTATDVANKQYVDTSIINIPNVGASLSFPMNNYNYNIFQLGQLSSWGLCTIDIVATTQSGGGPPINTGIFRATVAFSQTNNGGTPIPRLTVMKQYAGDSQPSFFAYIDSSYNFGIYSYGAAGVTFSASVRKISGSNINPVYSGSNAAPPSIMEQELLNAT